MKVFFNSSLTGKKDYAENYQVIFDFLKKSGMDLVAAPVMLGSSDKVRMETADEAGEYYKKLQGWIKQADVAIFEVSFPSLGVGHEISMALQYGKPVIALYLKGKRPFVLEGVPDEKLQVIEYDLHELAELLSEGVKYATEQMDTRFNFFISPKHQNYLDWISKTRKIPRAVYLRRLIEKDMEKNDDYTQ